MRQGSRNLTAVVLVFALAFSQGCFGPGRARPGSMGPESRVFLTRSGLFTLHHSRDGAPRECTARQAEARLVRMTTDSIVLREVSFGNGPTIGECHISGEAFVLSGDVPGLRVQPRQFSLLRTTGAVVVGVPVALFIALSVCYRIRGCWGGYGT